MSRRKPMLAALAATGLMLAAAGPATAATATSSFAGTVSSSMNVNNGSNTGSIPAGTPYTGTVTFDDAQTPAPVAYGGGTHTTYAFTNLAFTVGTSTANSGPGRIDVYDNLTSASGYPNGDSLYVNFGGVAPSGLLAGAAFNWMGLALLDPTGAAITNGRIPAGLSTAAFPTRFSEFNFGTLGTPWGAGNTSMIQTLTSLTTSGGTPPPPPPPPPVSFQPALPDGMVGSVYSAAVAPATGGSGSFTYAASGLPAGLALSGTTVSGTPATAGTFTVTLTATDTATATTTTATVTLTIAPRPSTGSYTAKDEGSGRITAIDPNGTYVMVGAKKLIWDAATRIVVNTPSGELHVVDSHVTIGMKVQWKGLRDKATNTVLTSQLEIN